MHKKAKENSPTTLAWVTTEMAEPRMARSARIAELKLDAARISEPPSITVPGTVKKILPSSRRSQSEKVQIAIDGADSRSQNLRIENTLTDENGDDVRLKKGACVEVTVTAKDVNRRN
jgi:hypothetical protein